MTTLADYCNSFGLTWMGRPYGLSWLTGKGNVFDGQSLRAQQGVMARFPGAAPNDAIPLIANDRAMSATFGDDASYAQTRKWLLSAFTSSADAAAATPSDPARPGYYYAGTSLGLIAALVNSGWWTTDANGALVKPRIYTNRDLVNHTGTGTGIVTCASCLPNANGVTWSPDFATHTIVVTITGSGTAGTSGSLTVAIDGAGAVTYNPIPKQVVQAAAAGKVQLSFSGAFVNGDTYHPSPPDQRTGGWARYWLVLPAANLITGALLWGGDGGWLWGDPPTGGTLPATWGGGTSVSGPNAYSIVRSICQRWGPGHASLQGAWLVSGSTTAIDSIPAGPWSEYDDAITFGGVKPQAFYRFNPYTT